ncbi:MAG: hypothetical protein Kow0060_01660 [Methylohalobius crimeensis]
MIYIAAAILALLLPWLIHHLARRLFPAAGRSAELQLLFGAAALMFGGLLWSTADDFFSLAVGWWLIVGLGSAGYRAARLILRK